MRYISDYQKNTRREKNWQQGKNQEGDKGNDIHRDQEASTKGGWQKKEN